MPLLIGNKANQVPTNGMLGTMAFQDASNPRLGATVVTAISKRLVTNTAVTYAVLERDHTIVQTTAASVYTLPVASDFPGRILHLLTQFAGAVTSASSNVVPITGGSAGTAIIAATAGKFATLQSNGTNWLVVAAN